MNVVIYTPASGIPPEAEAIAEEHEAENDHVLFRNGSAWNGYVEPSGKCYAAKEEIRERYEEEGVPAEPLFADLDPVEEPEEGKDFYLQGRGSGWYDVVSEEGEPANSDALRKEDAVALRDRLNSGEVVEDA